MKTIKSLTEAELAELPKLPDEWKWARLGEIHILKSDKYKGSGESLFYVGLEHINKDKGTLTEDVKVDKINTVKNSFKKGDLLYGKLRPYLNKVYLANEDGVCSTDILVFESTPSLNLNYSKYFFLSYKFVNDMTQNSSGVNLPRVSTKYLQEYPFPIAPLPEQRAIVSKIEQLFSELDNGITNLKLAQEQLKVYRQAVLKKAFEGELTVQWRKLNSVLYEWESKQLNEIAKFIDYRGKTPQKTDDGIPLITAKNVRMGFINEEPREFIAESDYDKWMTRGIPKKGDILFTTEAPLGYVAQLNTNEKIALAQRLITFQPIDIVTREYLKYYLMSPKFQTKLHLNSTGTTVKGIKAATLKKLSIDIPSIEEQQAIVQEIETRLSVCDKIEQDIETNLEKAEALRQSILKKAFEGKLLNEKELAEVRGAEDWEPAEVLLERIKAEKAENGKKGKQTSEQLKSIIQEDKGIIQQATLQAFEQIDK